MFFSIFRSACLLVSGLSLAVSVQAGVVLNTTRVIYPAKDKEVSLAAHNSGRAEILLQSWLESGIADADPSSLPFVITPGLARMPADARQLLRIIYAGSGMPEDRESVFWLNVQEIPQEASENTLQIAIRQRIKVFFRPRGLSGDPFKAADGLKWRVFRDELQVENPSPYHVSMIGIGVRQGSRELMKKDSQMLAPRQSLRLPLKSGPSSETLQLEFASIDDFGAHVRYRTNLNGDQLAHADRVEPQP
ncbi:P pilus assembly chaperone PapD [Pseudomonas sp. JUb42]|uniref:fimbrial biogenesis chaperone n=1 Tax=Pseudomonas sp. JUb42 TaxID=2940611 RepID=UPI0021673934|nr:molecular chaperone [Pseudomonas sp. JUb42]MCS3470684.1 P pilus assembly chaperone PapD [Pseudomonas sp. JUb42]